MIAGGKKVLEVIGKESLKQAMNVSPTTQAVVKSVGLQTGQVLVEGKTNPSEIASSVTGGLAKQTAITIVKQGITTGFTTAAPLVIGTTVPGAPVVFAAKVGVDLTSRIVVDEAIKKYQDYRINNAATIAAQQEAEINHILRQQLQELRNKDAQKAKASKNKQSSSPGPSGNNNNSKDPKGVKEAAGATVVKKAVEEAEKQRKKYPNGIYRENLKHHQNVDKGISPAPKDGQTALNHSISLKGTDRRVAIEGEKFVILDKHLKNSAGQTGIPEYHGHVRTFEELPDKAISALRNAGLINSKTGRILPK